MAGRRMVRASMEDLNRSSDEFRRLAKILACSFCGIVCPPPTDVMACEEGHFICSHCGDTWVNELNNSFCMHMEEKDGMVTYRCKETLGPLQENMYSHIHQTYKFPLGCSFAKYGCHVEDEDARELSRHEIICPFSPNIGCPFEDCEQGEMNCSQFLEHLCKAHNTLVVDLNDKTRDPGGLDRLRLFNIQENQESMWIPAVFKYEDVHFLMFVKTEDGHVCIWMDFLEDFDDDIPSPEIKLKKNKLKDGKESYLCWPQRIGNFRECRMELKYPCKVKADEFVAHCIHDNEVLIISLIF